MEGEAEQTDRRIEIVPVRRRGSWAALGVLLVVAGLAAAPGWMPGRVLAPAGDYADAMESAGQQWRRGQVPMWDGNHGLGGPIVGSREASPFYPGVLVHAVMPGKWGWTVYAMLHLWVAGAGAMLVARRYGTGGVAGALAGVAYMMGLRCHE